jgi:hypothetical protein
MLINYITFGDIFEKFLQALPSFIMKVVYKPTATIDHESSSGLDCFVKTLITSVKGLIVDIAILQTLDAFEIGLH